MLLPHGKHKGKPGMTLNRPFTLAGARNRAHLHLVSSTVSKCHAAIVHDNGRVYVRDLCSRTHVYVNGRIVHEMELADGDLVQIGSFTFKLQHSVHAAEAPAPTPGQLVESNNGGGVLPLDGRTTVIGRRPGCDLHIDDESVSTIHAIIFELDGQRYVRDLGSRTGTFVNGVAAHQQPLNFNDRLRVGPQEYIYRRAEVDAGTFDDMAELEDLVGTARLGHDELASFTGAAAARRTIAEPGVPVDEGVSTHNVSDNGYAASQQASTSNNSDLIPLASDEDWLVSEASAAAAPSDVQAGPEAIDLDADNDIAADAADTIPMSTTPTAPAIPPTISSLVQDFPARSGQARGAEPLAVPADFPKPAEAAADDNRWDLDFSVDDAPGGTLGAMSKPAEPTNEQASHTQPLAEPVDFPEMDDLGMSAHVIGVMPAQWASGPEATPLAVGPADLPLPVETSPSVDAVEAWPAPESSPSRSAGSAASAPPATDSFDASSLDTWEIQPGDIDPNLTEAGLSTGDAAQANDFDLDELMADELPAAPAEEPSAPSLSIAAPDAPPADAEATWMPEPAPGESLPEADQSALDLPSDDAPSSGASADMGLDFLEATQDLRPALAADAAVDRSTPGHDAPESPADHPAAAADHGSARTGGASTGGASAGGINFTGVAVVAGAAAAIAAAANAASSPPAGASKRSLWGRLFGRKNEDAFTAASAPHTEFQQQGEIEPQAGYEPQTGFEPQADTEPETAAETTDYFGQDLVGEDAPPTVEDSAQDLDRGDGLSWPPKSATGVAIGGAGEPAAKAPEAPQPPMDVAETLTFDTAASETAEATEAFEAFGEADNNRTNTVAEAAPAPTEVPFADAPSGETTAPNTATPDQPRRPRPPIGVAEITLSGAGGFGGQMVLSGAGPVEQLWGFGSGRSLSLPTHDAATEAGAAPQQPAELAAGIHAAPTEFPGTLSSTPIPQYPTGAVDSESLLEAAPVSATGTGEEVPQDFFDELAEPQVPAAPESFADEVASEPASEPASQPTPPEAAAPTEPAWSSAPSQPAQPAVDPFSLLGRDQGSFFGGMPLPLGSLQPEPPRPSRPRLPFADRPVTMDTRAEMLAEVTMMEPDAMPMFGASPPGVRDDTRFTPIQSDLVPLSSDDDDVRFDSLVSGRLPTETPQPAETPRPAAPLPAAPLPAADAIDNTAAQVSNDAGLPIGRGVDEWAPGEQNATHDFAPVETADALAGQSTLSAPDMPPEAGQGTIADDSFADLLDELELPGDSDESASTNYAASADPELNEEETASESGVDQPAVMDNYVPQAGKIFADDVDPLERTEESAAIEVPLEEPTPEMSDPLQEALQSLEVDAAGEPASDQPQQVAALNDDLTFDLEALDQDSIGTTDQAPTAFAVPEGQSTVEAPSTFNFGSDDDWLRDVAPETTTASPAAADQPVLASDAGVAEATMPAAMPLADHTGTASDSESHVSHAELVHEDPLDVPPEPHFNAEHVTLNAASLLPPPPEQEGLASGELAQNAGAGSTDQPAERFVQWESELGANSASQDTGNAGDSRWTPASNELAVAVDLPPELEQATADDVQPESGFMAGADASEPEMEWFDLPELTDAELSEAELFEEALQASRESAAGEAAVDRTADATTTATPESAYTASAFTADETASPSAETTVDFELFDMSDDVTLAGVDGGETAAAPSSPIQAPTAPPLDQPSVASGLAAGTAIIAGAAAAPAIATPAALPAAKKSSAAAPRPATKAAPAGGKAPLARKLEKPAGPRRVIAAKPASTAVATGFRPPVMPTASRPPAATVPARSTGTQPAMPAHRAAAAMPPSGPPRDPFTNTGDAIQPAAAPKRSKRRLVLILIAVVLTIAAIAAVWLMMKPPSTVQGRLQYRGLDNPKLTTPMRQAFQTQQIAALTDSEVLGNARSEVLNAGMSLGLLDDSRQEAIRLTQALENARWDERSNELVIAYPGATGDADRERMLALLRAVKRRYDALPKASAGDEAARLAATARADEIMATLHRIEQRRTSDEKLVNLAPERLVEAENLQKKADALQAELEALPQKIRAMEREVTRLENLAKTAGNGVADADQDPELKRLTAQLKALNDSLSAAMETATASTGSPKDALDAAQRQFDTQVAAARDAAAGNIVLAGYLEKLSALQTELRRHNEELAQQQKDQREMLEKLRSRLAQETANRIQRAWDADPQLKNLVTKRAVAERQYNVAASEKLPEAAKLTAEIAELDKQIEALRGLIAAKDEYDPLTKQFLAFIDDSVKLVDQSRKRNEQRLKDLFDAFVAAKPDMDKLPADQKTRTEALDAAYSALSSARAQYHEALSETAVRADLAVRTLTQEVAAQQAKVDARKREMAEARAIETGEEPAPNLAMAEPERLAAIEAKRQELTEARQSEAKLQNDWIQTNLAVRNARAEADQAEAARLNIARFDEERVKLNEELHQLNQVVAATTPDPISAVAIADVVPESAIIVPAEDQRPMYSFLASVAGLFMVLMALAASRSPGVYIPPMPRHPGGYDRYENEQAPALALAADSFTMSGRRSA